MTTKQNYYEVGYIHIGVSIGAMGQKHTTLEGAIAHINNLKNDSDRKYNKYRKYFVTHIVTQKTVELVYTDITPEPQK